MELAHGAGCPLDCLRKRGSGFYRFGGFSGGGAAHKNKEAPRSIELFKEGYDEVMYKNSCEI